MSKNESVSFLLSRVSGIIAMILLMVCLVPLCRSFTPSQSIQSPITTSNSHSISTTKLFMGKGLNKFKNKQADLKRKLELAKQQKQQKDNNSSNNNDNDNDNDNDDKNDEEEQQQSKLTKLSDEEIKEMNDRKRFEQLLQREGTKMFNDYASDGYLNKKQEEEEITAARSAVDRIFEGDPAPTDCFENLVSVTTENKVAKKGAGRLVPWISKDYSVDIDDYRVIICDPRKQSYELHSAMKDLQATIPKDIKDRLYFINADTPAENRRWLKKNGFSHSNIDIYCDNDDLDWMRTYTALGDKRWSMTMFVISKGRVQKLARDLDIYNIVRTVTNAVKSMKNEEQI